MPRQERRDFENWFADISMKSACSSPKSSSASTARPSSRGRFHFAEPLSPFSLLLSLTGTSAAPTQSVAGSRTSGRRKTRGQASGGAASCRAAGGASRPGEPLPLSPFFVLLCRKTAPGEQGRCRVHPEKGSWPLLPSLGRCSPGICPAKPRSGFKWSFPNKTGKFSADGSSSPYR